MKHMSRIKAVLFDLDGTLRFNRPAGRDVFLDYAASLGVPISAEERRRTAIWEHYYWAESPEVLRDVVDYPDSESFWLNYARQQLVAAGAPTGQAQALAPEVNGYMRASYRPDDVVLPGTFEVLARLREVGYKLGVVSNRDRPFGDYLAEKGLAALVDFSISGGEAGSKKPDSGIFEYALRRAGAQADEAIYVGDSYFADVVGARRAGIQPILFDPQGVFDGFAEPEGEAPEAGGFELLTIRSHAELLDLLDGRVIWPGNKK
jgi:FMN phosphatase YigB (HAD superfamily)